MSAGSRMDIAAAIRSYGAQVRSRLAADESSAVSYAGLWLLLASLAPAVEDATAFRETLGLSPSEATDAATRLLAEPHPTVAAAWGAWLAQDVVPLGELPVPLATLPPQHALDEWATRQTQGVVDSFPLQLEPETMLVLASALVLTPRWRGTLLRDEAGLLVVTDGAQAVVDTSVGPVAVSQPATDDGVDVLSVIAPPGVPASEVWPAVDEVLAQCDAGRLRNNTFPDRMPANERRNGHAWSSRDAERVFWVAAPEDGTEMWESRVPPWSATNSHEFAFAPGVALVSDPLVDLLPADPEKPTVVDCVQNVAATYDEAGFSAAAVTAWGAVAGGIPERYVRTVREVRLTFDRPHALIAVARGGAWDGIPLFQAWLSGPSPEE